MTCVLPEAHNIWATPSFTEDETGGLVRLTWDVSVRDDDNLEPCEGGRNWKVRASVYGSTNIPEDFKPGENAVYSDWENVRDDDTNHTMNFTFTNNLYYLFEVGHRKDQLKQSGAEEHAEIYASHVFYFGRQGQHLV